MIELRDVWAKYSEWALKGVTITFEEGKGYLVMGPNASGKTTLLKVASFVKRPDKGKVVAWGRDPWADKSVRGKAVYVPPEPVVVKGTVWRNVTLGFKFVKGDESWAEEALEILGIKGLKDEKASSLSSGQKALVSLARALAVRPEFLFLDEILNYLDREKRESVLDVLEGMVEEGKGVALVTHWPLRLDWDVVEVRDGRAFLLRELRSSSRG